MRTTYVNKSLPVELGEDIVVKSYKRGSPEAAMPIIDPKPSYLILSYQNPRGGGGVNIGQLKVCFTGKELVGHSYIVYNLQVYPVYTCWTNWIAI